MPLQSQGSVIKNNSGLLNSNVGSTNSSQVALTPGQFGGATAPTLGNKPGLIQPHPVVKPTTAPKKVTTTDTMGNVTSTEYHAPTAPDDPSYMYNTATGQKNPNYKDPNTVNSTSTSIPTPEPPKPTTPQVGTTTQNAQNVLNAGNQTPQEKQTYEGLFNSANYANDPNSRISQAYKEKQDLQDAYAKQVAANSSDPVPLSYQVGRGAIYANQYGQRLNAAETGISNALAGQGQQISGLSSANSAAQNTASRAQSGAGTVLGASLPGQISGSSRTYNPLDPSGTTGTNGIIEGANNQSTYDLQSRYNEGLVALKAADAIQDQIVNTLASNPTINQTPVSALTNLNELLSGQTSQPGQQLLAQQIHQYITALGLDPATVVDIASQQKGTLGQLLDSLRQTAQTNNEAKNPKGLGLTTSNSSSGSGTSSTSAGGYNFKLVNDKWVPA